MVTTKKVGRPKTFDRDAALERALDLFLQKNYQGAGLTDLLQHMQIARQSLYDTFKSKYQLFLEAFDLYEAQAMAAYHKQLNQPGSPLMHVETVIRGWGARAKVRPFGGCLINAAAVDLGRQDPQVAERVRKHFQALTLLLRDSLQNAIAEGELMLHADALGLARLLVVHCQGLIVMGHAGVNGKTIDNATEAMLNLLPGV